MFFLGLKHFCWVGFILLSQVNPRDNVLAKSDLFSPESDHSPQTSKRFKLRLFFIDCRESQSRTLCRKITRVPEWGRWGVPGFWKRLLSEVIPKSHSALPKVFSYASSSVHTLPCWFTRWVVVSNSHSWDNWSSSSSMVHHYSLNKPLSSSPFFYLIQMLIFCLVPVIALNLRMVEGHYLIVSIFSSYFSFCHEDKQIICIKVSFISTAKRCS